MSVGVEVQSRAFSMRRMMEMILIGKKMGKGIWLFDGEGVLLIGIISLCRVTCTGIVRLSMEFLYSVKHMICISSPSSIFVPSPAREDGTRSPRALQIARERHME